jgi:hypothetical protein
LKKIRKKKINDKINKKTKQRRGKIGKYGPKEKIQ